MQSSDSIKFINKAGGCLVSKNILEGQGQLRWAFREKSSNPIDNGWRFISGIDDKAFLEQHGNFIVCDLNTVANIEPAILGIYHLPVGSDLQFVIEDGKRCFYDNTTGKQIDIYEK